MKKTGWTLVCCCILQSAIGQVSDDFSDENFTANPAWVGDDAKFEVLAGRLHLNDALATGEAYLSTGSQAIADAEWRFSLEITENPSTSNYTSVYLVSDQTDLSGDLNGYFVKVGGANDEVSLFRQDGTTQTLIIDGTDKRVDTKPVQLEVKVTRDALGNWELGTKLSGDAGFSVEGSVLDDTHQTSAYFGVYCKYTSTRKDAFFFDDIAVTGTPQPDTQRPQVTHISVPSSTQLSVQFSEAVTTATAGTVANYTLPDHTISAAVVSGDAVTLTVQPAFENATDHTLSIRNIADEAGNMLADTTLAFFYFEAIPAQWNSVVVSELMPDPNPVKVDLPDAEYVELYNRSEHPFDLQGWTLNGKSLPPYILRPQEYVIVCAPGDSALFAPFGDVLPLSSWPALSNSGSSLLLQDDALTALDSLAYAEEEVTGGISLERIREETPCDRRSNLTFSLAAWGGTPGQANTVIVSDPDTVPPQLRQVEVLHDRQLQLRFDERVSDAALQTSSVLLQPVRTITVIERDTTDEKIVWVTLADVLQHDTNYAVTFLNARDCYGNAAPSQTQPLYFDNQPPLLVQTLVHDTAVVQLVFSEKITTAEKQDYGLDTVATPPKSLDISADSTSVILHFPASFADGQEHTISVRNLQDQYGNITDSLTTAFRYAQAIDTVIVVSEYQVDVYLAASVAPTSATDPEHFEIDRGVGHPQTSFVDSEQPNLLHGVLAHPLTANREHELSISDLYDVQQQLLSTPIYRFYYDQSPPGLDSIITTDERTLWVYFNETVSASSASNLLHYQLAPQGKITQARLLENPRVVQITLDTALIPETEYELQVLGVSDLSGNVISSSKRKTFIYDQHAPRLLSWKIVNPYQLHLYFSEAVAIGKVTDFTLPPLGAPDSLSVSIIQPQEVRLFFDEPLLFDTATLTIHQIRDLWGNELTEPVDVPLTHAEMALGKISVLSPTELRLDFTQAIDGNAMQEVSLYQRSQTQHPAEITLLTNEPYALQLTFAQPFQPDVLYPFSIERMVSASGKIASGVQDSFRYQTQVAYLETEPQAVLVHFSVPVDSGEAVRVAHYQRDVEHPVAALWVDPQTVRLVFDRQFMPLTRYTLTLSGLRTIDRDLIPASGHTVGLGRSPGFNELLITEVMADPSPPVGLPEAEYLEFYNASSDLLSTAGLKLSDATSTTLLPTTLLLPGEYLIVSATADQAAFAAWGRCLGVSSFPSLNSSGDHLQIRDADGREVFSVEYSDDWYNDADKKQGGWSLEMIDPARPCGARENWTASIAVSGGTPGKENAVHQSNPDTKGPLLTEAFAVSDTVVRVRFSETIDPASLSQGQFMLSHGLTVDSVLWQDRRKAADLILPVALQNRTTYTVQAEHLRDCSGNSVDRTPLTFVLSEIAEIEDLLLSELLVYPRAGGVRFVELYNASEKHINLKGWQLANLEGDSLINRKLVSAEDYLLAPQHYLALTENITTLMGDYPAAAKDHLLTVAALPSLSADAGTLVLLSPSGEQMQLLEYDEDFHHPALNDVRGVSLERIRWEAPVNDPNNWQSAASTVGYATPGYANAQATQAAISPDNLSVAPRVFTPDQDGLQDYTQIHYQWPSAGYVANVVIFDSQGRRVRQLAHNRTLAESGFLRWDGTDDQRKLVPMGYYLIYFEVFHTNGQVSVLKERVVVGRPL
ncbi:MAG: lamin tail domain-containing protein [Cyclobacteriaceae bacterium]